MAILAKVLRYGGNPEQWGVWGEGKVEPGQSITIGSGMGPFFNVVGTYDGAVFQYETQLNASLTLKGQSNLQFNLFGTHEGKYMAQVSVAVSQPVPVPPTPHPPSPPSPPPSPSELVSEWEFILPRNLFAFFYYAGNSIPGNTVIQIILPDGTNSAQIIPSYPCMEMIPKNKLSRKIKLKAFHQPVPGQPNIIWLRFYVRQVGNENNEYIISVVKEDINKEAVCNLVITDSQQGILQGVNLADLPSE